MGAEIVGRIVNWDVGMGHCIFVFSGLVGELSE